MAMTVKDVREVLKGLPDDRLVVMSKDGEGNGFSPLSLVETAIWYTADSTYSGNLWEGPDEDNAEPPDGSVISVVLWPTN